jgi:hypothetical protein
VTAPVEIHKVLAPRQPRADGPPTHVVPIGDFVGVAGGSQQLVGRAVFSRRSHSAQACFGAASSRWRGVFQLFEAGDSLLPGRAA